jgi:hypothetical protein
MNPLHRSILCLSCLNGQFKAAVFNRGSLAGSWEHTESIDDFSSFPAVLKEAVEKTGYSGDHVAMVLAHPRLSNQLAEVPPVKGWKLQRLLRRRVDKLKTFEGEAVWSYQRAMPIKNSQAMLVHLFPKPLLDQLASGCTQRNLHLVRALPTTAVLSSQLKALPLEKDEVALLAAETGPTTTVVIGRRDGRVCLGRVLPDTWNTRPDRVAVDLTRTIGFAEQQTGLGVTSVWLFGAGTQERLPAVQALVKLPVKASPVEWTPTYWAEQAARLPEKDDGNLISHEQQQAPMRRRLLTATGLILLVVLLAALGTAGAFEWLRGKELKEIEKQTAVMIRLQEQKTDWERQHRELERKLRFIGNMTEEKPAPVPASFLGYLGDAVPEDLLLTEVRVKNTNDAWSVRLAGVAQPTTNTAPDAVFSEALALLTNNLVTGPFHLNITRSVAGDDEMAARPTPDTRPANAQRQAEKVFKIEGFIR